MKRTIAWIAAALLLFCFAACIPVVGCVSCSGISCNGVSVSMPLRYADAEKYTAGNFTYESAEVKKVEIEWASGDVTLKNGTGTLSVSEAGSDTLKEEERLHWWIDGTTLKIKYCKSGTKISLTDLAEKDLSVELPAFADLEIEIGSGRIAAENMLDLGKLEIDSASGGTDLPYLSAKEVVVRSASGGLNFGRASVSGDFKIETASGGFSIDEIFAETIDVKSASGDVSFGRITAKKVDVDNASGHIALWLHRADEVEIDSASGSVRIRLDDKEGGASIRFRAVSGSFRTELPYEKNDNTYTIGNGLIRMDIDVTSGSVTIE